ncbi:UNVERIFIED_CONTAM: hypothetical protein GTU68_036769 [Idotea baltica]|nr:hypothetical protein [Idotea baltica]
MITIDSVLNCLAENKDLCLEEMQSLVTQMMNGKCSDIQVSALLMGLRLKGETVEEIMGAALAMRSLMTPVDLKESHTAIDIVGTGGDSANLFNISTAASFVVAAAGGKVAKHGNRAVSSSSGSADVLEQAGIYLNLTAEQVALCVDSVGVGFMFAPYHHSAMKNVAHVRKELKLRTIFNALGPLTNPSAVRRQLVGVYRQSLCRPLAEVLKEMGSEHALVVHSQDGLDEISLACPTHVVELKDNKITEYTLYPEDLGVIRQTLKGLDVYNSKDSLVLIYNALGERSTKIAEKAADMIALNAGAAIYISGLACTLKEGVILAYDTLYTGSALKKLKELAAFTAVLKQENEG